MSYSKVCLNMIVKDESAIIEDTLQSLVTAIDYYVICDTGSTDNTVSLITSIMKRHNIPGELHTIEFINFEYAFNTALQSAYKSSGVFDYILRVDADHKLEVHDAKWKEKLTSKVYALEIYSDRISYFKPMLLRKDADALYKGLTHEKLVFQGKTIQTKMIRLFDKSSGHSRQVKYKRDIDLLEQSLQKNPEDSRSYFYLGQSCLELEQYEKAIRAYKKRISLGGWREEVFYSHYKTGIAFEKMGKWENALEHYLTAFELRPHRIEPLFRISLHYQKIKKPNLALLFSSRAMADKSSKKDKLFIRRDIYSYKMELLHARNLFKCGHFQEARKSLKNISSLDELPTTARLTILALLEKMDSLEK